MISPFSRAMRRGVGAFSKRSSYFASIVHAGLSGLFPPFLQVCLHLVPLHGLRDETGHLFDELLLFPEKPSPSP